MHMMISAARPLPSPNELLAILKQELPNHYTCKLYGLGKNKSIIVAKSSSIAAQISTRGNEITIQGSPPPPLAYLLSAVWWNEFVLLLLLFGGLSLKSRLKDFEKELSVFLKKKFS
jgi:hypothetical protein